MKQYLDAVDQAYATLTGTALETRLTDLLISCQEKYGTSSMEYVSMLSEVGSFYRGQRKFPESEKMFKKALALVETLEGTLSPNYATVLNNLAGTHRLMRHYDTAEKEFLACLEFYRNTLGETHILYASGLNNLSLVFLDQGKLDQASELQSQAADLLRQIPECLEESATSLCNLGALYLRQNRLQEAEKSLLEAIRLYEFSLGTNTPHYHAALNTLGLTYYKAGRYDDARQKFTAAADAALRMYGENHREYQAIMDHLNMIKQAAGNL